MSELSCPNDSPFRVSVLYFRLSFSLQVESLGSVIPCRNLAGPRKSEDPVYLFYDRSSIWILWYCRLSLHRYAHTPSSRYVPSVSVFFRLYACVALVVWVEDKSSIV